MELCLPGASRSSYESVSDVKGLERSKSENSLIIFNRAVLIHDVEQVEPCRHLMNASFLAGGASKFHVVPISLEQESVALVPFSRFTESPCSFLLDCMRTPNLNPFPIGPDY